MDALISVVVPIYNVEQYLSRCLKSVINQTYKNLQIILINDGSTDKSLSICLEYKENDKRIIIVNQENGGLAKARNVGIEAATGDYIVFIDSDDYIANTYIESLYGLLIENDADIAICGYKKTTIDNEKSDGYNEMTIYNGRELVREIYDLDMVKLMVAWNKMFKLSAFKDRRFPVGMLYEDFVLMIKMLYDADRVVVTDEKLYFYYQREYSITNQKFTKKHLDCLLQIKEKLDFFRERKEVKLQENCIQEYEVMALKYYYLCKKHIKDSENEQKFILKSYAEKYREMLKATNIKMSRKIFMVVGRYFPYIMGAVANYMFP
jgi:glycosyltransferase involved in cell wall biosynthesis